MKANLRFALLSLALAGGTVPSIAIAQSGPIPRTQAQPPTPPAQAEPCEPPAKPLLPAGVRGQSGCQLDGVIRPPVTGDRGVVNPPASSRSMPMPVIPPPGSPGGDPSVQPK